MPETESHEPSKPEEILAEISVFVGGQLEAKFAIEHGEYIIGRDATCHIVVDADQISRHHARLTFSSFELVIEDLSSSNGVFIDGVEVQLPTRIRLGQEVQIGSARLFIQLQESAARQLTDALWDTDLGLGVVRAQLEGLKYRVITTINRGGMGIILQARDLRIRRTVAMKVMKTGSQFSRENVLRFIDEAQLTGQLEHPNIVPVYELGIDEQGETFYTMKFVKGITLDDVLRGIRGGNARTIEKYPLGALLTIFQKVCDGVAFAHAKGVVHRDLKPENIMIGSFGEVLVMDWGLAKNITASRREAPPEGSIDTAIASAPKFDDLRGFETLHGLIVGTPPYISPEQARGELDKIDGRSDIYVLGGILYSILTLRPPVEGTSVHEVVEKILGSRIKPPSSFNASTKSGRRPAHAEAPEPLIFHHCPGKRIPDGLSAVVMKAMHLDAAERYPKVEALQEDIAAFQGGFAPKAERASLLRHALLFAGRHKRECAIFGVFAVIFHVLVIGFFLSLKGEKDRALASERATKDSEAQLAAAVAELRGTAPTFYDESVALVSRREFEEALGKVDYAIKQVPNEAHYHLLRGHILQTLLRWDDAIDAYEDALARNPNLAAAQQNLSLTRKLLAGGGPDHEPDPKQIAELHAALLKQKRVSEAAALLEKLGPDRPFVMKQLKELAETDPAYRELRPFFQNRALRGRVQRAGDGTFSVDFRGRPLAEVLPFLKARPVQIGTLYLDEVALPDLGAIAGLPLRVLSLAGCSAISDITPLKDMPLERLNLSRSGVTDLSALTELPLRDLQLEGCANLKDLTPLGQCRRLESLILPRHAQDIAFLQRLTRLKFLGYKSPPQSAADFWRDLDAKKRAAAPLQ